MTYEINSKTGLTYSFSEREAILNDLAEKINIVGSFQRHGQYLQLTLKNRKDYKHVKSILKKHFQIKIELIQDWVKFHDNLFIDQKMQWVTFPFVKQKDIIELCEIFLSNNQDIDYFNRFDPLRERDKISKVVYQYGKVNYHLL